MRILIKIGWLLFMLSWIPFIFVVTGMKGGPVGEVVDLVPGGWLTLMLSGFGSSMIFIFGGSMLLPAILNAYADFRGFLAYGAISDVRETGTEVNDKPVLELTIRVEPTGDSPFTAKASKTAGYSDIHALKPGQGVTVRYVPGMKHVKVVEIGTDKDEFRQRVGSNPSFVAEGRPSILGFLFKIAFILAIPTAIIGFVVFIMFLAPKYTEVYACAAKQINENEKAEELLGKPIEPGFFAFGNYESENGRTDVYFSTPVYGSKSEGTLNVDSVYLGSSYSFRMKITTDEGETEIYNGQFPCNTD